MKKIYKFAFIVILGIVFSGCGKTCNNVEPSIYHDRGYVVPTRVIIEDSNYYLRRNAYGDKYYY